MRILVMGTGGLGGYFGGLLVRAGEEVACVARGSHLAALRADGLRVRSRDGDFATRVRVTDRPGDAGPVDLILFTVKTYDVDSAAEALHPAVGPETAILCLQNGVETEDRLGAVFGRTRVLGGVTYVSAAIEAPGIIRHTGPTGDVILGEMNGRITPRVRTIESVLQRAGVRVTVTDDITRALWEKFVFICAAGGMTAVTRAPLGEVMAHSESRQMFRGLMEETATVGASRRVRLDGIVDKQMAYSEDLVQGAGFHTRTSLYHDLAWGKRLELDALCGAVVRMGGAAGVPTPLSFAVVAALRPHERRAAAAAHR